MSDELPPAVSRIILLVLATVAMIGCLYLVGSSLVAGSAPGLGYIDHVMSNRWSAAEHPAQYWTTLGLFTAGALVAARIAWSAYRR